MLSALWHDYIYPRNINIIQVHNLMNTCLHLYQEEKSFFREGSKPLLNKVQKLFWKWNRSLGHKGLTCSLLVQLKTLNRVTTQNSLGPSLVRLSACPRSPSRTNLAISGFISTSPIGQTPSFIKKKKNASFLWKLPRPGVAIAEDLFVFSDCDKDIQNFQRMDLQALRFHT